MDKQLQPNNHKKHDSPLALSVSIEDEGIIRELYSCFAPVIVWNVSTWTDVAWTTRAWVFGIAHPATKATIKATVLCPSEFSLIPNVCT
jgi:hypothetical protein